MDYQQLAALGLTIPRGQLERGFQEDLRSSFSHVPTYLGGDPCKPRVEPGEDLSHLNPRDSKTIQTAFKKLWSEAGAEQLARLYKRNQLNAAAHVRTYHKKTRHGNI